LAQVHDAGVTGATNISCQRFWNGFIIIIIIIIINLPNQAIASTPSAPRPTRRQKEGAPLKYVCNYYAWFHDVSRGGAA
jgi:hypothetical protein